MARYSESKCRLCRREGNKLFLKGDRCYTGKCAMEAKRRPFAPGEHGKLRKKVSNYGMQLREKQKVKRIYGILERQFRLYYEKANRMRGITGHNLLALLERRLDNVVYRMGFASTRAEARHLVTHAHFSVNGKRVNIASFLVKEGDAVELKERSRGIAKVAETLQMAERRSLPRWIEVEREKFRGVIRTLPTREDVEMEIREQLIVELYSK